MLREHSQQQRDGQLRAQVLQQLQEAGTTVGSNTKVGDKSPGGPGNPLLVTEHRHHLGPDYMGLNSCAHLPGTYHVLGHQLLPTWAHT